MNSTTAAVLRALAIFFRDCDTPLHRRALHSSRYAIFGQIRP